MPAQPLQVEPGLSPRRWARLVPVTALAFFLLAINLLQLLSLLIKPLSKRVFRAVNRWCADTWWGACVVTCQSINGFRLIESGDELPEREDAIVVANHQQMPDIVAIMTLARRKHCLGDLKFFVKHALKWVPGVGWGMQFLDCVFVRRNWSADREGITRTFHTLVSERVPMWLVSFVEGTRIKPAKLASSQRYAEKNGIEPTRHVLLPRTKGFAATVLGLREHVQAVYDLTIGYPDGVPTLWQFTSGAAGDIHVHIRRHPTAELPTDDEALRDWLLDRFREKDDLLDHFLTHGSFPD